MIFVDTSALYAVLDASDRFHQPAAAAWSALARDRPRLITHNYVLLETSALLQRRVGAEAVGVLRDDLAPVLGVTWVDRALHDAGWTAVTAAGGGDVSLVDRVSFELMRRLGVREAFAFDRHFTAAGFVLVGDARGPGAAP